MCIADEFYGKGCVHRVSLRQILAHSCIPVLLWAFRSKVNARTSKWNEIIQRDRNTYYLLLPIMHKHCLRKYPHCIRSRCMLLSLTNVLIGFRGETIIVNSKTYRYYVVSSFLALLRQTFNIILTFGILQGTFHCHCNVQSGPEYYCRIKDFL